MALEHKSLGKDTKRIMRAIADLGYTGYVGQEFIPSRDPLESLEQGVKICTV